MTGAVTVFRAEALPPVIDLNSTSADLTVFGEDSGDQSGGVAAGDINGDGIDDLIIGAPFASPAGRAVAGATYVIYGGPSLPATIDLNSTSADLTVFGEDSGDFSAGSAAGDINGDGTDDLIIGASGADPAGGQGAGETYVIYGGPSLPAVIDLNSTSADLTVFGDDFGDSSGGRAAGDINGDGSDDLIIGAPFANPAAGRVDAGETYVIYGGPGLPATIDLNSTSADLTVFGDDAGDRSRGVAAGDINGDGTDDLIIGASGADPAGGNSAGETYVIYGGPSLPAAIDLNSTSASLTVFGDDAGDRSGAGVTAGDINSDTIDDLIIGASNADPAGRNAAGETYIIHGGPGLPATIDLNSTSADLTVFGDDAFDLSGFVAAGDINGNGTDDLIIGAPLASPAGGFEAGETYVIHAQAGLPTTIDLNSTSADLTVFGDDAGDWSGVDVAAGDINGDTIDDLIIGAVRADPAGGAEAGETYVIYGEALAAVGGVVEIATGGSGPSSAGSGSSARDYAAPVAIAIAAGVIALAAGGWYARRRWLR